MADERQSMATEKMPVCSASELQKPRFVYVPPSPPSYAGLCGCVRPQARTAKNEQNFVRACAVARRSWSKPEMAQPFY